MNSSNKINTSDLDDNIPWALAYPMIFIVFFIGSFVSVPDICDPVAGMFLYFLFPSIVLMILVFASLQIFYSILSYFKKI